jgi:hypothetical protein
MQVEELGRRTSGFAVERTQSPTPRDENTFVVVSGSRRVRNHYCSTLLRGSYGVYFVLVLGTGGRGDLVSRGEPTVCADCNGK